MFELGIGLHGRAQGVMKHVAEGGKIARGDHGVDFTRDAAEQMSVDVQAGVLKDRGLDQGGQR